MLDLPEPEPKSGTCLLTDAPCVCGVLRQLFDIDNHVNRHAVNYIFNTEGHLLPVSAFLRQPTESEPNDVRHPWRKDVEAPAAEETNHEEMKVVITLPRLHNLTSNVSLSPSLTTSGRSFSSCTL